MLAAGVALLAFMLLGLGSLWLARPFGWDSAAHGYASWLLWSCGAVGIVLAAAGFR